LQFRNRRGKIRNLMGRWENGKMGKLMGRWVNG
jgi:hypothetical protein